MPGNDALINDGKRPVGRPRNPDNIEELHRQEQFKQMKLAARIRQFTEDRLDALEKGIEAGAVSKQDLESFKVAVSANVEAQKITEKVMGAQPVDADVAKKDGFSLEQFLKEQQ